MYTLCSYIYIYTYMYTCIVSDYVFTREKDVVARGLERGQALLLLNTCRALLVCTYLYTCVYVSMPTYVRVYIRV